MACVTNTVATRIGGGRQKNGPLSSRYQTYDLSLTDHVGAPECQRKTRVRYTIADLGLAVRGSSGAPGT